MILYRYVRAENHDLCFRTPEEAIEKTKQMLGI